MGAAIVTSITCFGGNPAKELEAIDGHPFFWAVDAIQFGLQNIQVLRGAGELVSS